MDLLILILGFSVLFAGADVLIKSATYFARKLGISPMATGLTIVAFGTSVPELFVTMIAGLNNNSDLAIANILGSNITNILLVLGVVAILRPLPVHKSVLISEIPFLLTAALLVGFLANAALFSSDSNLSLNRPDGAILLVFFFMFMLYVCKFSHKNAASFQAMETSLLTVPRATSYLLAGMLALYLGAQWTVTAASALAHQFEFENAVIGLTIVALGTSTPELVTSAVAAYKNQTDIAIGNVIGSNIFNLLWVLGLTSSFVELPFNVVENTDIAMVIMSSALLIFAVAFSSNNTINRLHGVISVCLYVVFLLFVVNR